MSFKVWAVVCTKEMTKVSHLIKSAVGGKWAVSHVRRLSLKLMIFIADGTTYRNYDNRRHANIPLTSIKFESVMQHGFVRFSMCFFQL